jgi:hypothetical protein
VNKSTFFFTLFAIGLTTNIIAMNEKAIIPSTIQIQKHRGRSLSLDSSTNKLLGKFTREVKLQKKVEELTKTLAHTYDDLLSPKNNMPQDDKQYLLSLNKEELIQLLETSTDSFNSVTRATKYRLERALNNEIKLKEKIEAMQSEPIKSQLNNNTTKNSMYNTIVSSICDRDLQHENDCLKKELKRQQQTRTFEIEDFESKFQASKSYNKLLEQTITNLNIEKKTLEQANDALLTEKNQLLHNNKSFEEETSRLQQQVNAQSTTIKELTKLAAVDSKIVDGLGVLEKELLLKNDSNINQETKKQLEELNSLSQQRNEILEHPALSKVKIFLIGSVIASLIALTAYLTRTPGPRIEYAG